jgi:digeranylgeranylglycerophospholipid reductase
MYDVIIVGAGPAGCRTAELVARHGFKVLIIEEHAAIGRPTQCTGLVSQKIGKLPASIVVNKIKTVKFFSGDGCFEIKSKHAVYVIDRAKYDIWLAAKAKTAGAKFKMQTRFLDLDVERQKNCVKVKTSRGIYEAKIVVGADGPNSLVAKNSGIKLPKNILYGLQVRTGAAGFDVDAVELWFGDDIAPGLFAWVVPENRKTARVGLLTNKNPAVYLEKFLARRFCSAKIKICDKTGDVIRFGLMKKTAGERMLLVGDAACHVKPFSAGGLVYNKITAELAARAIIKSLRAKNFSEKFFIANYDKEWKKELTKPIKRGMMFKKIFSKFGGPLSFKIVKKLRAAKLSSFFDMDFLGKN